MTKRITVKELLDGNDFDDLCVQCKENLLELYEKMNMLRGIWNRPMIITSGFRTKDRHELIYERLGRKPPKFSNHLVGKAVDILDIKGDLMAWCKANEKILEDIGLWCEDGTQGWVHFQSMPPKSGKRFFNT